MSVDSFLQSSLHVTYIHSRVVLDLFTRTQKCAWDGETKDCTRIVRICSGFTRRSEVPIKLSQK